MVCLLRTERYSCRVSSGGGCTSLRIRRNGSRRGITRSAALVRRNTVRNISTSTGSCYWTTLLRGLAPGEWTTIKFGPVAHLGTMLLENTPDSYTAKKAHEHHVLLLGVALPKGVRRRTSYTPQSKWACQQLVDLTSATRTRL